MLKHDAPDEIVRLATQRAEARAANDWPRADALRADIETAGWTVVDAGRDFELAPARPADVIAGDRILYGAPESVPSRLGEPDRSGAAVVVVADLGAARLGALLGTLEDVTPPETSLIVVAGPKVDASLVPADVELIWTTAPFSPGAALQAALRRTVNGVVIVLGADELVLGDIVSPLLDALADDSVGIVGHHGLRSTDLRRYHPAEPGEVTVLDARCYAFRRRDAISRDLPDERLHLPGSMAAWWSLVLRDQGQATTPRRALALDLPLGQPSAEDVGALPAGQARLARRDTYRIAASFRGRTDLATDVTDPA